MAIFSRRTIQRLINENAEFLTKTQLKEHVRRLNRLDENFLNTEWEIALLNAFHKLGKVVHEPKLRGTNPDIHFTSRINPNHSFIADITTLSDKGLKQSYPSELFHDRFIELVRQRGLTGDSFALHIDGDNSKVFRGGGKPVLKLPTQPNFSTVVFNEKFNAFLDEIVNAPNEIHRYVVRNENVGIAIIYNPKQRGNLTSHLSYTLITSLTQNTIYNRLQEKAYKLVNAGVCEPLGLIVCDSGYSMFNRGRAWDSYGFDEVINYVLKEYPAISFILTVTVPQRSGYDTDHEVKMRLYKGVTFHSIGNEILSNIDKLQEVLPTPERNATNAVYLLKAAGQTHKGDLFWGGLEMSSNEIKISARVVLDLLAGRITQEVFSEIYHVNPFSRMIEDGCLIKEVEMQENEKENDDDWLVFRFGDADAAVSPFTVPRK
jgi:hypothetical protein